MNIFLSDNIKIDAIYLYKPHIFNLNYFIDRGKRDWGYNFILPSLGKEKEITVVMKLWINPEMLGVLRIGEISVFDFKNREYNNEISVEVTENELKEDNPEVRETFILSESMYSTSKNLDSIEKIEEIETKTRIILANPESREKYGDDLERIATAIFKAKTGNMDEDEVKKTKVILTKSDE